MAAPGIQSGFVAGNYQLVQADTLNDAVAPLERAVIEFRAGGTDQGTSNRTYGVHVPNELTDLPIGEGGNGVIGSLTSFSSINAESSTISTTGQINVPWQNFLQSNSLDAVDVPPPVMFQISRAGTTMTVRIGDGSSAAQWDHIWSTSSSSFADINGFHLRMTSGGSSAWRLTHLQFNGDLLNSTINSGPPSLYQSGIVPVG